FCEWKATLVSVHPAGSDSAIRVKVVLLNCVVSRVVTLVRPDPGRTYGGTEKSLLPVRLKLVMVLEGCVPARKNVLLGVVKLKDWLAEVGLATLLTTM